MKRLQRWAKKQVMQAKCDTRSILFGEDSARITHAGKIRFKALLSKADCSEEKQPATSLRSPEETQSDTMLLKRGQTAVHKDVERLPAHQSCAPFSIESEMPFKQNCNSNVIRINIRNVYD